jgi:hypothetical protein
MAITQGVSNSFKQELFLGVHDFRATGGDTFKFALYTSAANIGPTTTAYTISGESVGLNYPPGGATLTSLGTFLSGSTSFIDFQDFIFTNVTVTARGAMIYNTTPSAQSNANTPLTNPSVCIFDFGGDKQAIAGDMNVIFPAPTATSALIRIT